MIGVKYKDFAKERIPCKPINESLIKDKIEFLITAFNFLFVELFYNRPDIGTTDQNAGYEVLN